MQRSIKSILLIVPLLVLSGCILSSSPSESSLTLTWGQNLTFQVVARGTVQWSLDNTALSGATGSSYVFKSGSYSLGQHIVRVTAKFSLFPQQERIWTITVNSPTATVEVPSATGCLDIDSAGLVCSTVQNCSNTVPMGEVISQSPAAGTMVAPGTTVTLTLSNGECATEVPIPAAISCAQIYAAGLVCDVTEQCSNSVPQGLVIGQSPAAGTMATPGSTVTLILSSGPCGIEIPMPNATSIEDIENAGLVCNTSYQCSNTVPKGSVISQSPAAGTMVLPGSDVFLTLSSGPCGTVVPNATTCAEIEAAGLVCSQVTQCSNTVPAGGFIGLSPMAGTGVSVGSTVTLIMSSGPCPVAVPAATSCSDVTAVGLVCETTTSCSNTVAAGGVISQSPAAGTVVNPNSVVNLVISSGVCASQLAVPQNVQASDVVLTSVTDPTQNHNKNDRVTVTWNAVANATSYKIYRADTSGGTYTQIGTSTTTTYDDMQNETLSIPAAPESYTETTIKAYEAVVRPIMRDFKNFKYYKVQASSSSSSYSDSELSAYDQGRMDYTLEEFFLIGKTIANIPLMRLMAGDTTPGLNTKVTIEDDCGSGNAVWTITLSGVSGLFKIVFTNFVDSLDYNSATAAIECTGDRQTIANGTISGLLSASTESGTLTGSMTATGDFAGKFTNISVPIVSAEPQPGTCTVIYNGETVTGHAFNL